MKHLANLPLTSDRSVLERVVMEGAETFFLRNGSPLITSRVRVVAPGEVWAAAFERNDVESIVGACRSFGIRPRAIVPSVTVLGCLMQGDMMAWIDGPVTAEIGVQRGAIISLRRFPTALAERLSASVAASVRVPRELTSDYADAYGAAVHGERVTLSCLPQRAAEIGGDRVSRRRSLFAMSAPVIATVLALLAPVVAANRASARAAAQLAELSALRTRAIQAQRELVLYNSMLAELRAFSNSSVSSVNLLSEVTHALPTSLSLASLTLDTTEARLVVAGTRASEALAALDRAPLLVSPEIVGPITRELIGEEERERATVRAVIGRPQVSSQGLKSRGIQ
jgi:hypothetical protein